MKSIIEFKNVSFRYSENGPWTIKDVSFMIREKQTTAIIGHNGSGKSTIAKLMNGLLVPQEGEIWINGQQLTQETVWDIRKEVGMVFQNPDNQFVGATVRDDVAFGMENRGIERTEMEKRIEKSLDAVNMSDYLLTEPHRLSGGQKQRVAIAGIMAVQPKVMILDEATVMLDPQGRQEIMQTINHLQRTEELSLITVTHDLQEVVKVDQIIVLNKGVVWAEGTPQEILFQNNELKNIGLDVPFVVKLTQALAEKGIDIQNNALTNEELLEELWTLHSKT